jgi:hypothetical protein
MSLVTPYVAGAEFYLPQMPYLLPALCHPDVETIHRDSDAWVRKNMRFALPDDGAMERLLEERAALWTCYVLPTADAGRLTTMCEYTEYLSVFDNAMVDRARIGADPGAAKALFDRVLTIMEDRAVGDDFEWGRALQELWGVMRADMPTRQWDRFLAEVGRFLSGCVSEITSRKHDQVFDLDTYLRVRRDSVGMGMYFVLGEYGLGIDLTDVLAADRRLPDLIDTALEHIMLSNDLFSFRAECSMDDYVNALAVLMMTEGMELQPAVDRLFALIESKRTAFMTARDAIVADELGQQPEVAAYLDALWHMMAGNVQWSYLTSRYNGVGHVWNGVSSGVVTLQPRRTLFSDRPYHSRLRASVASGRSR